MDTDGHLSDDDAAQAPAPLFLSYAREDAKAARQIIQALERAGHPVWWDGLLESGARFSELTERALNAAPAVIVLWSNQSVGSHWVNDEAAQGRDRRCLVPVSIDGAQPPIGFRQFQVINLSQWRGNPRAPEFQRVLRGIAAVLDGQRTGEDRPSAPPTRPMISRRVLIAGAGAGVVAAAAGALWLRGGGGTLTSDGRSIAVLPFDNLSGDESFAYFVDGLSAELRGELARNQALQVMGQSSSEAASANDASAVSIARQLGVAYLLDGNVRVTSDQVRINAELIDGETGFARWSRSFDRPMGNILSIQSEIANAVTAALTSEIAAPGGDGMRVGGTRNVAAYDQYLRGIDLYSGARNEEDDRAALARFDAAIAADPRFASAHAARAASLTIIGNLYGNLAETRSNYAAARAAAERAVALAPDHAESHAILGWVLSQAQLDMRAAMAPFDRARALGSGSVSVLGRFALYAAQMGRRAEAIAAIDRAVLLDPLNARMHQSRGTILYQARDYSAALAAYERALALNPDMGEAQAGKGDVLYALARFAEARTAYMAEPNALLRETGLAITLHRLDLASSAAVARAKIVDGLGTGQVTFYQQAQIAAQLDEADVAFQALTNAFAAGDSGLATLRMDPLLDPIRQRPQFRELLNRLHFD